MSVRRRVLLLSIIFIALGISVSAILIAIGGGFSGSRSSVFNPPTQADLWTVGKTQMNEFDLQYIVTSTVIDGSSLILRYGLILVNSPIPTGMSPYQLEMTRTVRTLRYYFPKMSELNRISKCRKTLKCIG